LRLRKKKVEVILSRSIIMTLEAQRRAKVMELIRLKKIKQGDAAGILGISRRQVIRIYKKYLEDGDEGLNHGLIGKEGNRRIDKATKEKALEIYKTRYWDFGPTFASEKLEEEFQIKVNPNTLRLWLIQAGLWTNKRAKAKHRKRRERKKCFGEMLQMDGSIHDWFEIGTKDCLLDVIDDATGIPYGLFAEGETTDIAFEVLMDWILMYGIPASIYLDCRSNYFTKRKPTVDEQLSDIVPKTAFGKVCEALGIELIYATSPQAKGRVERAHNVYQDRLVKEMRLRGIKDSEAGNKYLKEIFWDKHIKKFAKEPASPNDMHVPLIQGQDLRNIICYSYDRKIGHDYVVRYNNRYFQIENKQDIYVRPRDKVVVKRWLDGSIHIFKQNTELNPSFPN